MRTLVLLVLTFGATYYAASFVQTIFHWLFGHTRRIARLYDVHVTGHHAQYAKAMMTEKWIPAERQVIWYYAIPFLPMVLAVAWLMPMAHLIMHLLGLFFAIWWHIYLHQQYHTKASWLRGFTWFRRKQRLHFIHHRYPRTNYAIVEYFWDRLLGTYRNGRL